MLAVHVVDDFLCDWVVEEAVDGEVAALGVVLGGSEVDGVGMAAVGVSGVRAEGGDFNLASGAGSEDCYDAERGSDRKGAAVSEELADLVGGGVGGDVVIL